MTSYEWSEGTSTRLITMVDPIPAYFVDGPMIDKVRTVQGTQIVWVSTSYSD